MVVDYSKFKKIIGQVLSGRLICIDSRERQDKESKFQGLIFFLSPATTTTLFPLHFNSCSASHAASTLILTHSSINGFLFLFTPTLAQISCTANYPQTASLTEWTTSNGVAASEYSGNGFVNGYVNGVSGVMESEGR
ncbi:hypothetical protein AAZV13_10G242900 [Glycine max]